MKYEKVLLQNEFKQKLTKIIKPKIFYTNIPAREMKEEELEEEEEEEEEDSKEKV